MKECAQRWTKKWREMLERYRYGLLVLVLGVVLLTLPTQGQGQQEESPAPSGDFQLEEFEARMEEILSRIQGAGETKVILTLDSGNRRVLAQDQERDSDGGTATTVVVGKGSGTQEVVALQTLAPKFRGALVVCPGGGDPGVKLQLIEAVSSLTGLGADRISVCQGNQ